MSNKMTYKIGSDGVTLVEVMISLVILLIVFMGLIQASLLSINHNLRNAVRDEAVRVGASSMSMLRSFNYSCGELDTLGTTLPLINGGVTGTYANCNRGNPPVALSVATVTALNNPQGNFRNFSLPGGYTVTKEVDFIDTNTKRVSVRVQWQYPGETDVQSHTIYYTMRNPVQ